MSILMIENLSHEYGDHTLYQKACLRLNAGEHMGITGLNGAGKSTQGGADSGGAGLCGCGDHGNP